MRVLVTAGNTQTPIDAVRCITNVFTGRTGTRIALEARRRGHEVVLLASHPEVVAELAGDAPPDGPGWRVAPFRTFDDLHALMARELDRNAGGHDAVVHAAAVGDYALRGVYVERREADAPMQLVDVAEAKVKGSYPSLWLHLTPTPKLADRVRSPWGFPGVFVKFKLEVGLGEAELREIAETSRRHSGADLMAANTLEGKDGWALLGPVGGGYVRLDRAVLAPRLLDEVERLHADRARRRHG